MSHVQTGYSPLPKGEDAIQVVTIFGGPLAVLASMQAKYLVVPWACGSGTGMAVLHLTALAAVSLAAIAGLLAMRSWRRAGAGWPDEEGGPRGRGRFLGVQGMILSAVSVLVIAAQWLPDLIVDPCQV